MNRQRFAIYYTPEKNTPLWALGSYWLGRDAHSGDALKQPDISAVGPDKLIEITETPRHYGFHATLKPPFRLNDGYSEQQLHDAIAEYVDQRTIFEAPPLEPCKLDGFLALCPSKPSRLLHELAASCVLHFDDFRLASSKAELQKRRQSGLTQRQDAMLIEWGYPYVMEEFRFHMTLSSRLEADLLDMLMCELTIRASSVANNPLLIDALTLFKQPTGDAPFKVVQRFPLK